MDADLPSGARLGALISCFGMLNTLSKTLVERAMNLQQARQRFRSDVQMVQAVNQQQNGIRYIDVGGTPFHISAEAMQRKGTHVLSVMASDAFLCEAGDEGYSFIDRDSRYFGVIVEYLRDGTVSLPQSPMEWKAALREVTYYGVQQLARLIRLMKQSYLISSGVSVQIHSLDGRWYDIAPDGTPHNCCTTDDLFYVLMDCTELDEDGEEVDDCDWVAIKSFDPETFSWAEVAVIPTQGCFSYVMHLAGDHLVLFSRPLSRLGLRVFDTAAEVCNFVPHPPCGVPFGCCVVGGQWFVFGDDGGATVSLAGIFGEPPEPWSLIPDMPTAVEGKRAAVAYNGKAVVVGHTRDAAGTEVGVVYAYDPPTATWSTLPSPPGPFASVAVVSGELAFVNPPAERKGKWVYGDDLWSRTWEGPPPDFTWTLEVLLPEGWERVSFTGPSSDVSFELVHCNAW